MNMKLLLFRNSQSATFFSLIQYILFIIWCEKIEENSRNENLTNLLKIELLQGKLISGVYMPYVQNYLNKKNEKLKSKTFVIKGER